MRLIDADILGFTDMEIMMCNGDYKEALKMIIDKIEKAPTIEPEQGGYLTDFCSNCSARMERFR